MNLWVDLCNGGVGVMDPTPLQINFQGNQPREVSMLGQRFGKRRFISVFFSCDCDHISFS